jgi:hypothetical protein
MPTPKVLSLKAYFAGFQNMEYTSGEVAAPTSPIPPDLASGAIVKNGTEVEITLEPSVGSGGNCANKSDITKVQINNKTTLFLICRIPE